MFRGKNLSQEFRRKCLFNEDSAGKIRALGNIKKVIKNMRKMKVVKSKKNNKVSKVSKKKNVRGKSKTKRAGK